MLILPGRLAYCFDIIIILFMTEFLTHVIHDQLTHVNPPTSVFDTTLDHSVIVPPWSGCIIIYYGMILARKEFNTTRAKAMASLALSLLMPEG